MKNRKDVATLLSLYITFLFTLIFVLVAVLFDLPAYNYFAAGATSIVICDSCLHKVGNSYGIF